MYQNQRFPSTIIILVGTTSGIMPFFLTKNQNLVSVYLVEIQQSIFHFEFTSWFNARSSSSTRKNMHKTKKGRQEMMLNAAKERKITVEFTLNLHLRPSFPMLSFPFLLQHFINYGIGNPMNGL